MQDEREQSMNFAGPQGTNTLNSRSALPRLLVSPREAARMLAISERTLFSLRKAGAIPAVQVGRAVRYSMDELQAWIRRASEKKCEKNEKRT
jgi:excisionase family DNA binding protein